MLSIEAFLKELGLEKYLTSFQGISINSIDQIKDFNNDELDKLFTEIGMLKGHLIKCRRRIQELKETGAFSGAALAEVALQEPQYHVAPPSPHPISEHQYSSSSAQVHYVPASPQESYIPQRPEQVQSQGPTQAAVISPQLPISGNFLNELENIRAKLSEIEQIKRDLSRVVDSVLAIDVDNYRKILDEISEYQKVLKDVRGRESGDLEMRD